MASLAVPIRRLTPENVLAMVEAGIIDEDERVELVDGVLFDMNPLGPEHEDAKERLTRHFAREDGLAVRVESMFAIPGGFLLPDLQVATRFAFREVPVTAGLVIEIAHSSQRRDREKAADYAHAGVWEYWIVDVRDDLVVVHRDPADDSYQTITEHRAGELRTLVPASPLSLEKLFRRA